LRYGDEVLTLGGRSIRTANEFKNVLGTFPQGWRIPLRFRRDDARREVHVRLTALHRRQELLDLVQQRPRPSELPPLKKPEEGEKPPRSPQLQSDEKTAVPEQFAKYIQKRVGYSNHYFNQLEQSRVWSQFQQHGDFRKATGAWKLNGTMTGGGEVTFQLGNDQSSGTLPEETASFDASKDALTQLAPQGSGGLLVALHVWRRLLVNGLDTFGEVYYLGTAPLVGESGLMDVLVGTFNITESRFYFHPDTGRLLALEMYPDTNVDPCEVEFLDYRPTNGRSIPYRMQVRHGDTVFTEIVLDEVILPEKVF
jgi:hypothetical protein